ncbi:MAG: DUF922 domain-containing protein [Burkholderiaceae bacterium]
MAARRCALGAALLVFAAHADGQVYRCERGGTITFSDRPCEAGSKSTQKTYATTATAGSLDLQLKIEHYDVRGDNWPALVRSLNANGPGGFHGLARWRVGYEYDTAKRGELCEISAVRVRVAGQILMPRWVDEPTASLDLQRRWSDLYAGLQRHEEGHIQHGRELAMLGKERLMGLGAVRCDQIESLAKREFDRLHTNLKTRDQEYDARTSHGTR